MMSLDALRSERSDVRLAKECVEFVKVLDVSHAKEAQEALMP